MYKIILLIFILVSIFACDNQKKLVDLKENEAFVEAMTESKNSFYYINTNSYPSNRKKLPIGIFDSGIGGLTVMDAIINFDRFNNTDLSYGTDSLKDFINEQFIYLADQANMPYSNYAEVGKENLLAEHVLKDVQFLMGNKYYSSNSSKNYEADKQAVKTIVIACNTATAYGKAKVDELINITGLNIKVIGVIDAGCQGAIDALKDGKNGIIAIFATPATVAANAYPKTLQKVLQENGFNANIKTYQQGGKGLHESIDEDLQFINKELTKPSLDYIGPSLQNDKYPLKKELLTFYNFNTANNNLLFNKENLGSSDTIQINSVENYVRYHIVSLLETIREKDANMPLKSIILGCTHYPYVVDTINTVLNELRQLKINGKQAYKNILVNKVELIDPAQNTAKELFEYLKENKLLNTENEQIIKTDQFYISKANLNNPKVETENGKLTYNYKYLVREANDIQEYIKVVPFNNKSISNDILLNIKNQLPETYKKIEAYIETSKK
ncbi:MAG: Asp/Glu/hydantoin racemase [Bacteroidetes bacterium]|nr:MAG: Asp/Glu/hydantoin racemase [Bacteroidota bacterium]